MHPHVYSKKNPLTRYHSATMKNDKSKKNKNATVIWFPMIISHKSSGIAPKVC